MKEAVDRIKVGGVKLPKLKGRTTIILKDVNTGEEKKVVKENMVTNAVAAIFANNFGNTMKISDAQITPIRNLFGGILCFADELTENANNIFPPTQQQNALVAHAGSNTDTAHENPKLGALNTTESTRITNGYRFVWDFATSQGNGSIAAVALTSAMGGNVGLTPVNDDFDATIFSDNLVISTPAAEYTSAEKAKYYPIRYDRENGLAYSVHYNPSSPYTFTEYVMKHPILEFGLNVGAEDWEIISQRTINLGQTNKANMIVTDGTDYYLFYRVGSKRLGGYKIITGGTDLQSETISISLDEDISVLPFYDSNSTFVDRATSKYGGIPIHNGYAYIPTSDNKSFLKINLTNVEDITKLNIADNDHNVLFRTPAYWVGDICVGYDFIINGDTVYPKASDSFLVGSATYNHAYKSFADTPSLLDHSKLESTSPAVGYQSVGVAALYMATINNLESAVVKTSSQTMKIQYEITEVAS